MSGKSAIVAHDAGGAEVLSSYVKLHHPDCLYALAGPALAVFQRKLGRIDNLSVAQALAGSDRLLCGTSWQSDLERHAILAARAAGKPSAAWLDHWVNYRMRFELDGRLCLPDEVWVSDAEAQAIAAQALPEVALRRVENPYFAELRQSLRQEAPLFPPLPAGQLGVLFVCEPVREHALLRFGDARHFGYTEEEALHYFLSHVAALGPVGRILVRPHPSEPAGKYDAVAAAFDLPVQFSQGHTLSAEVAASDCVVGCNSMAMVVGLLGGKRVISCIPPGGQPCVLPQPQIESLQRLLA